MSAGNVFAGDVLTIPFQGSDFAANGLNVTTSNGVIKCPVYRDILISSCIFQLTTVAASTFIGVGIYDLNGIKIASFDGFDVSTAAGGNNTPRSKTLAKPFVLKAGVYLFSCGAVGVNIPQLGGVPGTGAITARITARTRLNAANGVAAGGVCPATLGALAAGSGQPFPQLMFV